jgi:hypothetical protein
MRRSFKPSLIVGLGKYGIEIGRGLHDNISAKNSDLAKLVQCLFLEDDGNLATNDRIGPTFHCDGLSLDRSPNVFQKNFRVYVNNEREIENILADLMQKIKRIDVVLELREMGYKIDEGIAICIVSTLFDPIGSSAIIPFLGFVQYLISGRFTGTVVHTNLLGFFPDLFDEYKKDDLFYSRSFIAVQELDHILNNPKILITDERSPIHYVYLFTGKNEDAVEIGSYKDLIPMIGEVFSSLLLGEIASDESFSSVLLEKVDGKYTRYNSFGLSKLIYPVNEIMNGLFNIMVYKILDSHQLTTPKVYERGYIASEVKEFIIKNGLDRLSEQIRIDKEGNRIWTDFRYSGTISERVVVRSFIDDIDTQAVEYERDITTIQDKKLAGRKEELFYDQIEILKGTIRRVLDDLGKGILSGKGTYYAQAFLNVLENKPSPYLKEGSYAGTIYDLELIEKKAKAFFDKIFGIDRDKLIELKRDIDDKTSLLNRFTESSAQNLSSGSSEKGKTHSENDGGARERIETLKAEIEVLQSERETLQKRIDDFDFKISDPSERRKLLLSLLQQEDEKKGVIVESLEKTDSEYRKERRKLDELYEERKRIVNRLFLIFPAVGTLSYFVGLYLGTLFFPTVDKSDVLGIGAFIVFPVLLSIYAVWALLKYWNGIRREIKDSESRTELLKGEKISLLVRLQEFFNDRFKIAFEHSLQGYLLTWIGDYRSFVRETAQSLQLFIDALNRSADSGKSAYETITFPHSIFVRSVVTKNDMDRFVKENARLSIETDRFFREKPLSIFFDDFKKKGDLSTFLDSVKSFSGDVFKFVSEKSIEDFLRENESMSRLSTTEKLVNLFNSAKAFIHLDVEKGLDASQSVVYLGVEKSDSSDSKELLKKQGYGNIFFYSSGNKHELVMSKLKVGFPAFHIALIKHGKQLTVRSPELGESYVNTEWDLEDLFPTEYVLGKDDRELRKLVCMATAFNLIVKKRDKVYFENLPLGTSLDEIVEFLRSFKGSNYRLKLIDLVEREKQKEDAVDRLISYRETKSVKNLELELINEMINELSPLS